MPQSSWVHFLIELSFLLLYQWYHHINWLFWQAWRWDDAMCMCRFIWDMHVHKTMEKHMAYHNGAAYAQWSNKLPHGQEDQSRHQLGSEFLVRFQMHGSILRWENALRKEIALPIGNLCDYKIPCYYGNRYQSTSFFIPPWTGMIA